MATGISSFFRHLTRGMAAETLQDQSDRQLVERLVAGRDDAVFEAIVRRHGPMVFRVCWRVLQQEPDAEDAFQTTFLILARQLHTVRRHASLASWLHGIAHRVALKARAQDATRRRREQKTTAARFPDEVAWGDVRAVLDAELEHLPGKWRLPLILCYLEGQTQDEAAKQLGSSQRTLRRRLEEAKEALGRRLTARGVVWPAALSAVLLSDCIAPAALAPRLVSSTVEVACIVTGRAALKAVVSARVIALTEGVLKTMLTSKLKIATAALVMVTALAVGAGGLLYQMQAAQPPAGHPKSVTVPPGVSATRNGDKPKAARKPGMPTWTLQQTLRHDAIINGVAFAKDLCASWGEDGYIRLWDPKSGRAGAKLRPHPDKDPVRFAYFLPDDKNIFTISGNGALTVWEFGKEPFNGKVFTITNVVLGLGRDHQSLAVVLRDGIVVTRFKLPEFGFAPQPRDFVASVANGKPACASFTADGNLLAAGFDNGVAGLWDTTSNQECWSHTHHTGEVRAMALSPDDKLLATAGKDGTILLWDVANGTVISKLKGHEGDVRTVAFSPDGKLLVSGGEDKTARVWSLAAQAQSAILKDHAGAVTAVAVDALHARIITGSADGFARVWQLQRK
jgi:RNA polymerase sigma factor (sigma-70 family)